MVVYGARVTLEDNSAPTPAFAGSLLAPGWHKPSDTVDYSASDNSGIRSASLAAGPLTATDNRVVRLHVQGAVLECIGPLLVVSRRPPRRAVSAHVARDRRGADVREVTANVAVDGNRRLWPCARLVDGLSS